MMRVTDWRRLVWPLLLVCSLAPCRIAKGAPPVHPTASGTAAVLWSVQRRAFNFFWNESDPRTGLTKDRASNRVDAPDTYTVASIASTGYGLAALPVGVEHGWVSRKAAYNRALTTLRFVRDRLPQNHGFYYHFVDRKTGARVWNCELSSVDTGLLVMGALAAGQCWRGTEVQRLADGINARVDWRWMQTDGGARPDELTLCMGWKPETGWLAARWQGYSEASFLYWLALGSPTHALTPAAWDAWKVETATLEGCTVFGGARPLFMAQMAPGFVNIQGLHDRQGRDWWTLWGNAHRADRAYCARNPEGRKTYAAGFWGLNASDQPGGYGVAVPENGRNDGTVCPTAMLAAWMFTPDAANQALVNLWSHRDKLWGRYGFPDAFNLDKDWYDKDVLGIDLGMMLLATENARTGLIWRLMRREPTVRRGLAASGFAVPPR